MPASLNLPITSLPYSTKLSEIGRTFTCTGASHTGNFPAKCSHNIPINLSKPYFREHDQINPNHY